MTTLPKEKHRKDYYETMIARRGTKKSDQGKMTLNQLMPISRSYRPATQKVISPIQAQILKTIIENGNRKLQ